jgi:hypothetical protein
MIIVEIITRLIEIIFACVIGFFLLIFFINLPHVFFGWLFKKKKNKNIKLPDSVQVIYKRDESGQMQQFYNKNVEK